MRIIKMLVLSLICLTLCFGCGKKGDEKSAKAQEEEVEEEAKDAADGAAEPDSRTHNAIIAEAMEKTSKLASFETVTEGSLKLGGKTIKGEFFMTSRIQVVQGEDRQNLEMSMETEINPGKVVSKAYYKDGWYYTDDGKRKDKQKKLPEEVLGIITDITNMVIDASDKIENISVKENGADKIYSYELPSYVAEDYIAKLMTEMGAEDTLLEDASADVENLKLTSTVNAKGILVRQEISIAGNLKKAIVSVPVKAQITAEFAETDKKEILDQ